FRRRRTQGMHPESQLGVRQVFHQSTAVIDEPEVLVDIAKTKSSLSGPRCLPETACLIKYRNQGDADTRNGGGCHQAAANLNLVIIGFAVLVMVEILKFCDVCVSPF